jgi:CheY-like chemotaxis protein
MRKILLVDDQEGYGGLLERVLPGYEVRQEKTASEALLRAYQWEPDLFLLDLKLPDMNGDELAKLIRRDELLGRKAVIFVCAFNHSGVSPAELDGCLSFGKPFKIETLKRYIQHLLEGPEPAGIGPSESWPEPR